jgi:5-methylcytosine-specific restriction endonuclease McrA
MRIIQLPPARSRRDSQRSWLWAKRKAQEQPHYHDHLESEAWKETRRQVLRKYKQCYCCGARGVLDVHHLTYKNFGRENLKELRAVCRSCHHKIHYNQKSGDKLN